jgi:hypothetical protein
MVALAAQVRNQRGRFCAVSERVNDIATPVVTRLEGKWGVMGSVSIPFSAD